MGQKYIRKWLSEMEKSNDELLGPNILFSFISLLTNIVMKLFALNKHKHKKTTNT